MEIVIRDYMCNPDVGYSNVPFQCARLHHYGHIMVGISIPFAIMLWKRKVNDKEMWCLRKRKKVHMEILSRHVEKDWK